MLFFPKIIIIIKISFLFLSLFSVQTLFASSEDDYLKQLEMEADDNISETPAFIESRQSERIANRSALDAPSSGMELIFNKKELIIDEQSYEKALKGNYPESYALYQQFTDAQKQQIYGNFTQSKRLYNSSLKIISLYLASH